LAEETAHDGWVPARLLPTAGIRGQDEQEKRATSALLAVLPAVPAFGHGLLGGMGAPKGRLSCFAEVRLKGQDGKTHIPDGAIVAERAKTRWSCLVEVKTGRATLGADQISRYLDMARDHGFDGLLTISNQILSDPKALPYEVDKRKLGKLTVRHLSWWSVLTEAIVQHRFRGIKDPDQAWLLNELIRYLNDEKSGASGFEGMGEAWVRVREGVRNRTLRPNDPEAKAIAARWEQFVEYLCLNLSQELGVVVRHQRPRGRTADDRVADAARLLATEGALRGAFKVPDAVGPIAVEANLQARQVSSSVEVNAPKDVKRPKARVNWILRQLKDAPDDLRLEVRFAQLRESRSELLGDCRDDPDCLLLQSNPKREPRSFLLARTQVMGRKAGRGDGSFVAETRKQAMSFYRDLVQELRPPAPTAPKLGPSEEEEPAAEESAPSEGQARREKDSSLKSIAALDRYASA